MATIAFFRDKLTCDSRLIGTLGPQSGDTVVLGARELTLVALTPDYNYILVADQFTVDGSAQTVLVGTSSNRSPKVLILAKELLGSLAVVCQGATGAEGAKGKRGRNTPPNSEGGGPGGDGEDGHKGGDGSAGGVIRVRYCKSTSTPVGSAPGGKGGKGGIGGEGGFPGSDRFGYTRGRDGKSGPEGATGPNGSVEIELSIEKTVWDLLDLEIARKWANYRLEVGLYLFRKFDSDSQIAALNEFNSALILDSENTPAKIGLRRIIQRQIPTGLPRDLDVTLDYTTLATDAAREVALVQSIFASFQGASDTQQLLSALAKQLALNTHWLEGEAAEAKLHSDSASIAVQSAQFQVDSLASQISSVQAQIQSAGEFSFAGFVSTVGKVAGSLAAISTGVGAIVSIPYAIAAIEGDQKQIGGGVIDFLKSEKAEPDLKKLGAGLEGIPQAGGGLVNLSKVISQITGAQAPDGQGELLGQLAMLVRDKMIADLRLAQSQIELEAARLRVSNLADAIQRANDVLADWATQTALLGNISEELIKLARTQADRVAEAAFISLRALEIYQLLPPIALRFDYGHIHPDQDHDFQPAARGTHSYETFAELTGSLITATQIFNRLNIAQIDFDVVRPALAYKITEGEVLSHFKSGGGLEFSTLNVVGVAESASELKVDGVSVELHGATADQAVNVALVHSGYWIMSRRTDKSKVEFNLLPRTAEIICKSSSGGLTGNIPAAPTTDLGAPFSFWGRGVLSTWRLYPDAGAQIDATGLTRIDLTFYCLGYMALDKNTHLLKSQRNNLANVRLLPVVRKS